MDDIEKIIGGLVADLPETEREEAKAILRSCRFQDDNDPMLGVLRLWQLRERNLTAKERPMAASVTKLGEDLGNHVWEAKQLKLAFFMACIILAFFLGLGIGYYPAATATKTTDNRLQLLQAAGVKFRVEEVDQSRSVGVALSGNLLKTDRINGETMLFFRKPDFQ